MLRVDRYRSALQNAINKYNKDEYIPEFPPIVALGDMHIAQTRIGAPSKKKNTYPKGRRTDVTTNIRTVLNSGNTYTALEMTEAVKKAYYPYARKAKLCGSVSSLLRKLSVNNEIKRELVDGIYKYSKI